MGCAHRSTALCGVMRENVLLEQPQCWELRKRESNEKQLSTHVLGHHIEGLYLHYIANIYLQHKIHKVKDKLCRTLPPPNKQGMSMLTSQKSQAPPKDQKSYVLPHMWTLDQGQTQQGDWTMST
jgi:hypothetical protein